MKKLIVDLLDDAALSELKVMESEQKIRIINEEEMRRIAEKRAQLWKELEEYTYENIVKTVKESSR